VETLEHKTPRYQASMSAQKPQHITRGFMNDLQRNEERHIDSVVTFGRTQALNATASAL
ncbi:unnamed protein product, partial [Ectocarpus sp. 8 AP-2014]